MKKVKPRTKRTDRQKYIENADTAWSQAVKRKFGYRCQKPDCRRVGGILNSHHWVWPRGVWATRFEVNNGLCLCQGCHKFWAHVLTEECREVGIAIIGSKEFHRLKGLRYDLAKYSVRDLGAI